MAEFQRPREGFRFSFGGINLRDAPDGMAPGKYPSAVNIRSVGSNSVRTRPGYNTSFSCGSNQITDIGSYATLGTNATPRFLAHDSADKVYLDNGNLVVTLAGNNGVYGASLAPFRPSASPQAWMYVAGNNDYQKISAPDANNNVTVYKVGIAESPIQLEAAPQAPQFTVFTGVAANWNASSNYANNISLADVNFVSDTSSVPMADPVIASRISLGMSTGLPYFIGQIGIFANSVTLPIQDVLPAISNTTIQAIRYNNGSNGLCTVVTNALAVGDSSPVQGLGNLRRGALVVLGGNETVFVQSALSGANTTSFVCSTSGSHSAGESVVGFGAIVVDGSVSANQSITVPIIQGVLPGFTSNNNVTIANNTITATVGRNFSTSPFASAMSGGAFPQADDYVHMLLTVQLQQASFLQSVQIVFNAGSSSYSYTASGSALVPTLFDPTVVISFPISALVGSNGSSQSLASCNNMQINFSLSNNANIGFGSLWVGGGALPDVGNNGAPYQYQAIPRSSLTGAQGQATPVMRYGVNPRRQPVTVLLPSAAYDTQIDTFDVYRYGGSVTSVRYIGSVAANNGTFIDGFFDDTATAGAALPTQNFEPWPSIDVPFNVLNTGLVTIVAKGTWVTIAGLTPSRWPATIQQWLPGTIVLLNNQQAFTLRARPTQVSNNSYFFELVENAGNFSPSQFWVDEPIVARQFAPYMWGPDSNGFFFAVGDRLRPGTVYYSSSYAPDEAPQTNTSELAPPSEPLMNGEIIQGLSYVASTQRWWAMYPAYGSNTNVFAPLERPIGRGLAAQRGLCTDGTVIYFWAKDCIAATAGDGYVDLTSKDLFGLFPREGVSLGSPITRNPGTGPQVTYYPPNYAFAYNFRLSYVNGYLKADYIGTDSAWHTLIGFKTPSGEWGWVLDIYADQITCRCVPEQPAIATELMGSSAGTVFKEQDLHNDGNNASGIKAALVSFEWDAGDFRSQELWGDLYLDALVAGNMNAVGMSLGNNITPPQAISPSPSRQFIPISANGANASQYNFLGIAAYWTDNFANNNAYTTLYGWQPSFVPQPETTTDRADDFSECGYEGAKYFRGFVLECNTFGQNKNIGIFSAGNATSHQNYTINNPIQDEHSYAFVTPFVAHLVRLVPLDSVPWQHGPPWSPVKYIYDEWPPLTYQASSWTDFGSKGAKYMKGLSIPLDTNGNSVSLILRSSDGGNTTLGPFTTTAAEKTEVAVAIPPPFVGHEFQIVPANNANCRVWWEQTKAHYDLYPELTPEYTSIMEMGGPDAKFVQGILLTGDSNNTSVSFQVLYDGGQSGPTFSGAFNGKQTKPFSFATPFVAHDVQIVPANSVRIFVEESKWVYQPTPELAQNWITQGTAHGMTGYQHVQKIEAAWSSNANVTLAITSFDGTSPQTITLPSTGGNYQKQLFFCTFNKGQLYQYSAISNNNFQIFENDFRVWVKQWGDSGPYQPYRLLGGKFGDEANI